MKPNRIPEKSQKATSTQSEGVWDFSGILWIINCAALVLTGSTLGPSCGNLGPSFLPHMFAQPTHSKNLPARESTKCRHKGSARLGGGRHSPPGGLSIKSAAPKGARRVESVTTSAMSQLSSPSSGPPPGLRIPPGGLQKVRRRASDNHLKSELLFC